MPPYLRRVFWWFLAIMVLGVVASLVVPLFLSPGRGIPVWSYVVASVLPGLVMGSAGAWFGISTQRQFKRAAKLRFRVCWQCGYHLRGLPDAGSCPECGTAFDPATLREKWGGTSDSYPMASDATRVETDAVDASQSPDGKT
jgi:hypothetical protein